MWLKIYKGVSSRYNRLMRNNKGVDNIMDNSSLLIILTFYLGMMIWLGCVYMYRNTFKLVNSILLEFKYSTEKLDEVPIEVKQMFHQLKMNFYVMLGVNILAGLFTSLYIVMLGLPTFLLVSIPLVFLMIVILLLLGYYSNKKSKDVHKPVTLLG